MLRFTYQYVWRRGILDGRAGLVFSMLMAIYEAMIVAKRLELTYLQSDPVAGQAVRGPFSTDVPADVAPPENSQNGG
ncbi:MAG: hypothetical protein ACI9HK_005700 [Pirellulaceae bacterium]